MWGGAEVSECVGGAEVSECVSVWGSIVVLIFYNYSVSPTE